MDSFLTKNVGNIATEWEEGYIWRPTLGIKVAKYSRLYSIPRSNKTKDQPSYRGSADSWRRTKSVVGTKDRSSVTSEPRTVKYTYRLQLSIIRTSQVMKTSSVLKWQPGRLWWNMNSYSAESNHMPLLGVVDHFLTTLFWRDTCFTL